MSQLVDIYNDKDEYMGQVSKQNAHRDSTATPELRDALKRQLNDSIEMHEK